VKNIKSILQEQLIKGFKQKITLVERRPNLFQLMLPYYYPDGDMIEVFLGEQEKDKILIQDMGITLMRLSYEFSMDTKNKQKILRELLGQFKADESKGNISISAPINEIFPYIMQFVQLITRISDISYLKREVVKSLFYEYFDSFVVRTFKEKMNVVKDYYPEFDKEKQYQTPYALLNGKPDKPICFFPVASDSKCNEATITLQHYELQDFRPTSLVVFENQEIIGRSPLARLSNIVGKQFSTLQGNESRIKDFVEQLS